jgi:hypothetical protein
MHLDERGEPCWHDGDVVRIQFKRKRTSDLSKEYEYTRVDGYWPGEAAWWSNKTDAEMTEAWHENRLSILEMTAAPEPSTWPNQHIEPGVNGIWVAYTPRADGVLTSCAVFLEEIEARRWADVEGRQALGTVVGFVAWGLEIA